VTVKRGLEMISGIPDAQSDVRVLIRTSTARSEATAVVAREDSPCPIVLHCLEQRVRCAPDADVAGGSRADEKVDDCVDRNLPFSRGDKLPATVAVLSRSVNRLL